MPFPKNLFYNNDLWLVVQAVRSEPVSTEFPVKQGKNREFSRISPSKSPNHACNILKSYRFLAQFPKKHNRENFPPNRELIQRSREFSTRIREALEC